MSIIELSSGNRTDHAFLRGDAVVAGITALPVQLCLKAAQMHCNFGVYTGSETS